MGLIYVVALSAFAFLAIVIMIDTALTLATKPVWARVPKHQSRPMLAAVETVERRQQQLPFVGVDRRRKDSSVEQDEQVPLKRAA
jgi:anti-sigma-K factor RskA